jgi:coenzyme F420-reducing hydrogenase gamma subunit
VLAAVRSLLSGVTPIVDKEKVCMECKRQQAVCVMVTRGVPCMGPVTSTGCGALCPRFGRDCYACFGPSESPNTAALGQRFSGLGLVDSDISLRFRSINSHAPEYLDAGKQWSKADD